MGIIWLADGMSSQRHAATSADECESVITKERRLNFYNTYALSAQLCKNYLTGDTAFTRAVKLLAHASDTQSSPSGDP